MGCLLWFHRYPDPDHPSFCFCSSRALPATSDAGAFRRRIFVCTRALLTPNDCVIHPALSPNGPAKEWVVLSELPRRRTRLESGANRTRSSIARADNVRHSPFRPVDGRAGRFRRGGRATATCSATTLSRAARHLLGGHAAGRRACSMPMRTAISMLRAQVNRIHQPPAARPASHGAKLADLLERPEPAHPAPRTARPDHRAPERRRAGDAETMPVPAARPDQRRNCVSGGERARNTRGRRRARCGLPPMRRRAAPTDSPCPRTHTNQTSFSSRSPSR